MDTADSLDPDDDLAALEEAAALLWRELDARRCYPAPGGEA